MQQQMIDAIVKKNMFKPARQPVGASRPKTEDVIDKYGKRRLLNPFKLVGVDHTDAGSQAYLLEGASQIRRLVKQGDKIDYQTVMDVRIVVEILEIKSAYIRCDYGGREVRIDVGETSNDAIERIWGYNNADYVFIGTTIMDAESYAHVNINGRSRVLEVGDRLGEAEIIKIEKDKLRLRLINGYEYDIAPTLLPTGQ